MLGHMTTTKKAAAKKAAATKTTAMPTVVVAPDLGSSLLSQVVTVTRPDGEVLTYDKTHTSKAEAKKLTDDFLIAYSTQGALVAGLCRTAA